MLRPDAQPARLEPGAVLLVGRKAMEDELASSDTASVSCGQGRYACCGRNANGIVRAACIREGTFPDSTNPMHPTKCVAGGEGATECSYTHGGLIIIDS